METSQLLQLGGRRINGWSCGRGRSSGGSRILLRLEVSDLLVLLIDLLLGLLVLRSCVSLRLSTLVGPAGGYVGGATRDHSYPEQSRSASSSWHDVRPFRVVVD